MERITETIYRFDEVDNQGDPVDWLNVQASGQPSEPSNPSKRRHLTLVRDGSDGLDRSP